MRLLGEQGEPEKESPKETISVSDVSRSFQFYFGLS